MAYRNCPHCRSMNRDTDTTCYNCGKELDAIADGPPGGWQTVPGDTGRTVGSGEPEGRGYRPSSKPTGLSLPDRDSNLVQGIRSGAVAGACVGAFKGIWAFLFAGFFATSYAQWGGFGVIAFGIVVVLWVIEGVIIGGILGATNRLCYAVDAGTLGAVIGVVSQCILIFAGISGSLVWAALWGAVLGNLACHFEKTIFRKQYY